MRQEEIDWIKYGIDPYESNETLPTTREEVSMLSMRDRPERGTILYPQFDCLWRHNQQLGTPAWHAMNLYTDKNRPDHWITRVSLVPAFSSSDGMTDNRMQGKWMSTNSTRHGLVVLVDGNPPIGDVKTSLGTQAVLLLIPPDEINVLSVTYVGLHSIHAKVVKIQALP